MKPATARNGRPAGPVRWALRMAALAAAGVLAVALAMEVIPLPEKRTVGLAPHRTPEPALGHIAAAAAQQGQPTDAAAARAILDRQFAFAHGRAKVSNSWTDHAEVGELLLARAHLTGSFDDYVAAGHAFDLAFRVASPGAGPHLGRADANFALHRLPAMATDLAAAEAYAIPDGATLAAVLCMRGDIAFYGGRYKQALDLYEQAHRHAPGVGVDLRLSNYYQHMGRPDLAEAFLDQADSRITGPQQQLRAFTEARRGRLDLDRGRWPEAEARFRRADDIFPGYGVIEAALAEVLVLRGAIREAEALFARIAERDATPEAWEGLAGICRVRRDIACADAWTAKAWFVWEARLAVAPEAAMGHAAEHLLAFGDPGRALDLARRDYALRPYGDSAARLAAALLANDRPAEALAALAPTLASGWVSVEPHVLASRAYAQLGRKRQADIQKRAALAIDPHSFEPGAQWLAP